MGLAIVTASVALATTAHAASDPGNPPHKCFVTDAQGNLPTCSSNGDGKWTVTYDSGDGFLDPSNGGGIPSGFIAFGVLVVLIGIGLSIARVAYVRNIAKNAGMDPNEATAVSLLSNDGLEATYLAANLRPQSPSGGPPASPPTSKSETRSTQDRLSELQQLHDQGTITTEEYDARRKSIIDSI